MNQSIGETNDTKCLSHFRSFQSHSYQDNNGKNFSHMISHEKSVDGKESIKEAKRIGNKTKMVKRARNKPNQEWNTQEKTLNIDNTVDAQIEFDSTFDRIFGRHSSGHKQIKH